MLIRVLISSLVACAAALAQPAAAQTPEKIKIGILGPFSGPYAATGVQFRQGIETFLAQHGTQVGGREVEVIYRDVGGSNPAAARQLAEELIVKDKVSLLGGFYLSPSASAVSSVVTETKTPTVLFVAQSPAVIRQSPYFLRVAPTMWHSGFEAAEYGRKQGARKAYILVSDYSAGRDIQEAFTQRFTALGGAIVQVDRVPLNTVDYAAFAQRIADAKPDMVEMFLPAGVPAISFLKAMGDRGLLGGRILVMGNNETDDPDLKQFPDTIAGTYTATSYAASFKNAVNDQLKTALHAKFGPDAIPNFSMVGAYDGMQVFYHMIDSQKGKPWNADAALASAMGFAWDSPSGPVKIDATRNMTQNMFVREVSRENGKLTNAIVSKTDAVPDPWAIAHPAP
jgi:branched-chain amino acid transport system substrate-binding protein